jgi:NADP-dependent 3-hydroxy acid dehydrogenase YdfG
LESLDGRVALVTGASRGIGAAVASALARAGVSLPELDGMMKAEDVAEVVMFVLTRPRHHRILEVTLRPVTETSWG